MKVKNLFQFFVLTLLVFAEAFTVFPVSAQPASAGVMVAPLATNATGLKAPFPAGVTYTVTGTHDRAGGRHALDFGMSYADVSAMKSGTIVRTAFEAGGGGNMLFMDNGDFCTAYLQLERYYVTSGYVSQGTIIAQSGATGNVTGPNLHVAAYAKRDAQCTYSHEDEMPMMFDEAGGRELVYGDSLTSANLSSPTVVSIVRATSAITNAASVNFTVTFSASVTSVDTADFAVSATSGISGASVTNVSGSGSVYTVSVNTGSGNGDLRIDILTSATIANQPSNLPYTGNESYVIEKIAPEVSSVVRAGASPTNAASVTFNVSFSETVQGVDASDFALSTTGDISGAAIASVNGSGNNFTVTVNTGTGDGILRLDIPAGASITDTAGNALSGLPFAGGESFTIDKTAPTARISIVPPNPTNAASVDFNFVFSEDVTGVDASDFMLVVSPTISGAAIASVNGSGNNFTVTVNTGTGDGGYASDICLAVYPSLCGNLRLVLPAEATITDAAGNPLTDLPLIAEYLIDKTAPTVEITPPTVAAENVDFGVKFSESVMGLEIADFVLTATTSGASIVSVNGSEGAYTVTVNKGTGEGSLKLEMPAAATVKDMAGNAVAGLPKSVDYIIDNNLPVVVSIVPDACNGNFLVTFSETVKDVDAADFALVTSDTLNGVKVTGVSCVDAVCSVTVDTGTGIGTIRLNVPASATIADQAGNPVTKLPYESGKIYRILSQTLRSTGLGDGWVYESSAGSGVGGSANSTANTLNVGDDAQNRQFRSILNFPTYYLPDNAGILQTVLMMQSAEVISDPFAALGNIAIDIRGSKFVGGMKGLQPGYFEARADASAVGAIANNPVKTWYWTALDSKAAPYINLTGITQLRLAFQTASNNNGLPEYIKFYSGSYEMQKDRPHLQVRYCTPR